MWSWKYSGKMIRENKAGLYFNEMGDNLEFPGIL